MSLIEFVKPEFVYQDDRGCLRQLVSSGWNQVNVISSESDTFRGGHYHKHNREMFYIISGAFELTLECDEEKEAYQIKAGDMFIIPANVTHSFEFTKETLLVALYDNGVEREEGMDIHTS
jgi:quercetin dioxygenase-like cupin family protein